MTVRAEKARKQALCDLGWRESDSGFWLCARCKGWKQVRSCCCGCGRCGCDCRCGCKP